MAIVDPSRGSLEFVFLKKEDFMALWGGDTFLVKKVYKVTDTQKPFGLDWFIPEMLRHKKMFRDVGLAAMMVNILAVVFPVYLQLIFGKTVRHQAYEFVYGACANGSSSSV